MNILKQIGWLLLELLVYAILFSILMFGFIGLLYLVSPIMISSELAIDETTSPYRLFFTSQFLFVFLSSIIISWVHFKYLFKKDISHLGWSPNKLGVHFGKGWLGASILIIVGFLILVLFKQIVLIPWTWKASYFLGFLLFFIVQSTAEELITRSFLIPTIELRLGTWVAVIISGSLFAIMHIGNDNFTWVGFINILLGGLVMALLFVKFRNIWICAGYHAGWNFMQATLLDFNVSGVDTYSLLQFQDIGFERITGAAFGYEGSILAVLLQALVLLLMYRYYAFDFKSIQTAVRSHQKITPVSMESIHEPIDLSIETSISIAETPANKIYDQNLNEDRI